MMNIAYSIDNLQFYFSHNDIGPYIGLNAPRNTAGALL